MCSINLGSFIAYTFFIRCSQLELSAIIRSKNVTWNLFDIDFFGRILHKFPTDNYYLKYILFQITLPSEWYLELDSQECLHALMERAKGPGFDFD